MSASNQGGAVRIDNGPLLRANLRVWTDEVEVTTLGATRPDPSWSKVDNAGHFHAWDKAGKLPTLKLHTALEGCPLAHCDHEECEGWERSWYACVECADPVEPGRLPDPGRKFMPGMSHWSVLVTEIPWDQAIVLRGRRVSVVFHRGERVQAFGFAMGGPASGELGGLAEAILHGAGPLAQR